LDDIHWLPEWNSRSHAEFNALLYPILQSERWGNFGELSPRAAQNLGARRHGDLARLFASRCNESISAPHFRRALRGELCCNGNRETLRRTFSRDSVLLWVTASLRAPSPRISGTSVSLQRRTLANFPFSHAPPTRDWLAQIESPALSAKPSPNAHFPPSRIQFFVQELKTATQNGAPLCFDTEFLSEKRYYARLCLFQVLAPLEDGVVEAAIDPFNLDLAPLLALIADESVTKIVHSGSSDLQILWQSFETPPATSSTPRSPQLFWALVIKSVTPIWFAKSPRLISPKRCNTPIGACGPFRMSKSNMPSPMCAICRRFTFISRANSNGAGA
jgi:hypothetical protein